MRPRRIDWCWPLAIILVVILVVPIHRYTLPVNLPFEVEPYRVVVALVIVFWLLSLLAQPDVALRRSGLDGPVVLYAFSLLASDLANPGRLTQYHSLVIRALSMALSVIVVFYIVVSVVRRFSQVLAIVKLLVAGTATLAILALIESRTGWSPFTNLDRYVPMLQQNASFDTVTRGAIRAFGSAESPIALGALFAIMTPLSLYLAIRFGRWWWPSAVVLMGGAFATVSRTAIVMLFVSGLVVLVLRFRETWRYAPLLLIPMVVVVHFAVPGALGAMKNAFAPPGGLINEHKALWNGPTQDEYVYRSAFPDREAEIGVGEEEAGSGRLADIGPSLELFRMKPVFGYGYGTLQPLGPDANTRIVDNQWLSSLLNVGLVGVLALAWLFIRFVRGVGTWAFQERTDDGWLLVALVASVAAFGVGMFTLDSFAFTQVTFVFFVILGLGSALALAPDPVPAPSFETSPAPARPSRIRLGRQPALSAE